MIVVLVLITSCHVSEKRKIGPVSAHARTMKNAARKAQGEPTAIAVMCAKFLKNDWGFCVELMRALYSMDGECA